MCPIFNKDQVPRSCVTLISKDCFDYDSSDYDISDSVGSDSSNYVGSE